MSHTYRIVGHGFQDGGVGVAFAIVRDDGARYKVGLAGDRAAVLREVLDRHSAEAFSVHVMAGTAEYNEACRLARSFRVQLAAAPEA